MQITLFELYNLKNVIVYANGYKTMEPGRIRVRPMDGSGAVVSVTASPL